MTAPKPDTWMPLYVGDYLRDTGHLSAAQHGAYLLLIMHYWSSGAPLPDDDMVLWRIARADSLAHWRRSLRPIVAALFQAGDGVWRHRRVDAEIARATLINQSLSDRGKIGAAKRWSRPGQSQHDATANGQSMAEPMAEASPKHDLAIAQAMLGDAPSQSQSQDSGIELDIPTPDSAINPVPTAPPQAAGSPLDLKREMWTRGKAFLAAAGVPEKRIGPVLGRWRRDHGDAAVIDALAKAEAESPSEIVPYVEACLKRNGAAHAKPNADQITNPYVLAAMRLARPGGGD